MTTESLKIGAFRMLEIKVPWIRKHHPSIDTRGVMASIAVKNSNLIYRSI